MLHPSSSAGRLTRAGILGSASLTLAVGAHLLAGGSLPPALVLGAFLLGLAAVSLELTGRRLRVLPLTAILALEQTVLHLGLDAGASMSPGCATGHHAGALAGCVMPAAGHVASAPTAAMLITHLAATVLTAALLARGEAWLWRLGAVALARATARPTRRRLRLRLLVTPVLPLVAYGLPTSSVRLRGPPLG